MTTAPTHPVFPLGRTLAVMSLVAIVVIGLQLAIVPALFGSPAGAYTAVLLMCGLAWISGMLSVLPIVREQGKGPLAVVKVFFIGMAVRVLIAVVAIVFAVKRMSMPPGVVAVSTMMMYLPLLFVETRMLANYVKKLDIPGHPQTGPKAGDESATGATPQTATKPSADDTAAPCTEALA